MKKTIKDLPVQLPLVQIRMGHAPCMFFAPTTSLLVLARARDRRKNEEARRSEIYNLPVNLFNFPVKQEKRCINPPPVKGGG